MTEADTDAVLAGDRLTDAHVRSGIPSYLEPWGWSVTRVELFWRAASWWRSSSSSARSSLT